MVHACVRKKGSAVWSAFLMTMLAAAAITFALTGTVFASAKQKTFNSADEAVKALVTAARANDDNEVLAIFGPEARDIVFSGDAVMDKQRRERFLKAYDEKNSIVAEGNKMILIVGQNDWPFPIPLIKKGDQWVFDTPAGKEEILDRRIGENELDTIQTLLAIVDAQREYAMISGRGGGLPEYAEKFLSDPGKKNGLFWETKEGEEPSPLGPLVAEATRAGYGKRQPGGNPQPYHGYFFRILTAQGKNAEGGAFNYIVNGKMIGGFAVVAYPARYGNSGVMTFMVNHDGVVYQKNLGTSTAQKAKAIKIFDPDNTWKKAI
jgi:hypothetical protein